MYKQTNKESHKFHILTRRTCTFVSPVKCWWNFSFWYFGFFHFIQRFTPSRHSVILLEFFLWKERLYMPKHQYTYMYNKFSKSVSCNSYLEEELTLYLHDLFTSMYNEKCFNVFSRKWNILFPVLLKRTPSVLHVMWIWQMIVPAIPMC